MKTHSCGICYYEWQEGQNGDHNCAIKLLDKIAELETIIKKKMPMGLTDIIMQKIEGVSIGEVLKGLIQDSDLEEVVLCLDEIGEEKGFAVDLRKQIGKKNNTKKLTAKYKHHNNNQLYTIICHARARHDGKNYVVYQNEKEHKFIREESEFYGSILVEKEVTVSKRVPAPRFEKILE